MSLYKKTLLRKYEKLFLNNVKRGFSVPFFPMNYVRESVEVGFGGVLRNFKKKDLWAGGERRTWLLGFH